MGLLDSIVGGVLGGGQAQQGGGAGPLLQILLSMLTQGGGQGGGLGGNLGGLGGLCGLLEKLQQSGLGDAAASWVSTGPNQPVSGDQLRDVFGSDVISQIAAQAGLSHDDTLGQLSQMLPRVVDHLTPAGQVPDQPNADVGQLGDLIGSMLRG